MQSVSAIELKEKIEAGEEIQIIDVRQPNEYAVAKIEGAKLIPLGEILSRINEIDETKKTVVMCHGGVRSARAISALQHAGFKGDLINLTGGIDAWSVFADPSVPRY